jgi:peptidoglycan/LPS O-acetylase OafA/YrhL
MTLEAQPAASVGTIAPLKVRSSQYVPGLDLLRFLAASIVTVYHLAFWAWAYPGGQVARASKGVADFQAWANLTSGGWAGVQIFFLISGFVIATSSERATPLAFLESRFVRLVPGVWVCGTITLVAWLAVGVGSPETHLFTYLRSLAFMPTSPWIDSVYWTLGVEVSFYTLIFLLLTMGRFEWLKPICICMGLVSSLFSIGVMLTAAHPETWLFQFLNAWQWSRLGELTLLKHGVFFAIGVLLWLRLIKRQEGCDLWLVLFAVGGCAQIAGEATVKFDKTGLAYSPLLPCAMWLASVVWIVLSVSYNDRVRSLPVWALQSLRRLGLMTYPLYLLHNVAGGAVMGALANRGLSTLAALLLAITIIMGLTWWVSRVPEPALQRSARSLFSTLENRKQRVKMLRDV